MVDEAEMCLRDVLTGVMVEGKPLIRAVAEIDASTVMLFMNWDPIPNSKYHQS